MIAYFDTSAVVPLLIEEPGTRAAAELWDRADRLVSVALVQVEARAALAQAARQGRITSGHLRTACEGLAGLMEQLDLIVVDDDLIRVAGDLAEVQALRAYDAVHLAAGRGAADHEFVLVSGDRALLDAAVAVGLAVAAVG